MRKLCLIILASAVILSMTVLAQYPPKEPAQKDQAVQAPLKSIAGTVKAEGDKITFVADKEQKSWAVENPEALKGHEGHHVQVKAHVYADKGSVHIMEVKMLKDEMKKDEMKKQILVSTHCAQGVENPFSAVLEVKMLKLGHRSGSPRHAELASPRPQL